MKGIYEREDSKFMAGYRCDGKWRMKTLRYGVFDGRPDEGECVTTLTDAKNAREALLTHLRSGLVAPKSGTTFGEVFAERLARPLSPRTRQHESDVFDRYLATLRDRPVQSISTTDVAKVLQAMRQRYSSWTQVSVFRLIAGTFAFAVKRGVLTRNPVDGLIEGERPKQENAKEIKRLNAAEIETLVSHGGSERWRCAIALAGHAGLRIGEIRGIRWSDVDFDKKTLSVKRSLLPDGTAKPPKTEAGVRVVPLPPALRRALVEWKLRSPYARETDYVLVTADGHPIAYRNLRRALDRAKERANISGGDARLSWHSLRHSYGLELVLAGVPINTVALLMGHKSGSFTLDCYAQDSRDDAAVTSSVLDCLASAGIGA